jgi:hypothetical protein
MDYTGSSRWGIIKMFTSCCSFSSKKSVESKNYENYFHHIYFSEVDTKSEPCQRFIRDSLGNSFNKIFCDDAVQSWKTDIYVKNLKN